MEKKILAVKTLGGIWGNCCCWLDFLSCHIVRKFRGERFVRDKALIAAISLDVSQVKFENLRIQQSQLAGNPDALEHASYEE